MSGHAYHIHTHTHIWWLSTVFAVSFLLLFSIFFLFILLLLQMNNNKTIKSKKSTKYNTSTLEWILEFLYFLFCFKQSTRAAHIHLLCVWVCVCVFISFSLFPYSLVCSFRSFFFSILSFLLLGFDNKTFYLHFMHSNIPVMRLSFEHAYWLYGP